MSDGVEILTLSDGSLGMLEPEPLSGLDRRVFRRTGPNREHLEWAHYTDVQACGPRARWYGFASRELPDTMRSF